MSEEHTKAKRQTEDEEPELPLPWKQIQSAIWLIGLAILFWKGWFWPGILVLTAISGVSQALMQWTIQRQAEQRQATQRRADWLPSKCPNCGAPLSVSTVQWTGAETADCPYCHAHLKPAAGMPARD
ncbi:MAG TPA: hypothetical protein PK170_08570 [Anaerolineae bacterium]|nr:hypothetical protein [Anaerolineae bacterium]